jgi:hypothetical protein
MTKFATMLFLSAGLCSASAIIYNVDQTIGVGEVTGFVETDGTIGVLGASNILNWNLLLNDGTNTIDLLGPLSGSNSALGVAGSDLSATATQLLFNFSGSDDGWVLFQAPVLSTGSNFWCSGIMPNGIGGKTTGCSDEPAGEALNVKPDPNEFTSLSGTQVIASTIPEPGSLALFGSGLLLLTGVLRRKLSR